MLGKMGNFAASRQFLDNGYGETNFNGVAVPFVGVLYGHHAAFSGCNFKKMNNNFKLFNQIC